MNPLFQISTKSFDKEIIIVKHALDELEKQCSVNNGYIIESPFEKFGWTFFNIQISLEMAEVIDNLFVIKSVYCSIYKWFSHW